MLTIDKMSRYLTKKVQSSHVVTPSGMLVMYSLAHCWGNACYRIDTSDNALTRNNHCTKKINFIAFHAHELQVAACICDYAIILTC